MADHSRFRCPCCGKQLYLVKAGDEDEPIVFATMFFPSPADVQRAEQAGPQPLLCPLTGNEIDLDSVESNVVGSHHDTTVVIRRRSEPLPEKPRGAGAEPGEVVPSFTSEPATGDVPTSEPRPRPAPAPRPSETVQRIVRCHECRVMFDLQQTAVCPRCGAAPPSEEPDEEAASEEPTKRSIADRLKRRPEEPATSEPGESTRPAPARDGGGGAAMFLLRNGKAIAAVLVLAIAGSGAGSFLAPSELAKLVCTVVAIVLAVVGYLLLVTANRLRKVPYYRKMLDDLGEGRTVDVRELGEEGVADAGARPAHVRLPVSPTRIGEVRYLSGHPDGPSADSGELWAGPTGIEFQGAERVLGVPARQIERVRGAGGQVPRVLALVFFVLAYLVLPKSPGDAVVSDWAPWAPILHHYLFWGYVLGLAAVGLAVLMVIVGLLRARHHKLTVRYRDGDEHVDVWFRSSFAVVLRARQLIRSG